MTNLGVVVGMLNRGYSPADFNYIKGQAEVWDAEGGPAGRLMLKAARDVLIATGRGHTAPAFHLNFLCKMGSWDPHTREVAQHVAQLLEVLRPHEKRAFGLRDALSAGGLAGRGALLGSVGLGGGLGALYWLLSRHANQDSADISAMQNQVDYYRELGRELEDSMRRKYRYERGEPQQAELVQS